MGGIDHNYCAVTTYPDEKMISKIMKQNWEWRGNWCRVISNKGYTRLCNCSRNSGTDNEISI